MKERLQKQYGSLRMAAVETNTNYYRLSQIVNGWVEPKPEEVRRLKITDKELEEVRKNAKKQVKR